MAPSSRSESDNLQGFLDDHFPAIEGLSLIGDVVADHAADLHPEERAVIATAVVKRQHEFATGRYLARKAMVELGLQPNAVGRSENRRPIWPKLCLGSISHAGKVAIAAVAHSHALQGVGVDLEESDRVVPQLHAKLFTEWERTVYAQSDSRWTGLLFSAKEAGYKAVNPVVGQFIGFQEVEIDVDWSRNQFAIRYVGGHPPNKLLDAGLGHFGFFQDHVVSRFVIP